MAQRLSGRNVAFYLHTPLSTVLTIFYSKINNMENYLPEVYDHVAILIM